MEQLKYKEIIKMLKMFALILYQNKLITFKEWEDLIKEIKKNENKKNEKI
jgi:hypothetical protein